MKSRPVKLVSNNEDIDPLEIEMINNKKLPTIEDDMANGKNQAYKIINSTKSQIRLEIINELGSNFNFNMQKTK